MPLIVYFPPKWRHLAPAIPGSRSKDPISFVDFAPTVLSLLGLDIPKYMQGGPFAGPAKARPNAYVYCTRDRMDERYDMMRSVMDSRWLYIRNFRPDLAYVQPLTYMFTARGYQSWAVAAAEGKLTAATAQFWGPKPVEELYDMDADPDNVTNLAADPAQRTALSTMRAALGERVLAIQDNGFIPEGSPLEGFEASRRPGAYPIERVLEMARLASDRDPANLPKLVDALDDPCEPIRWWAAQGCTMLAARAATAEKSLRGRLDDESGAVQVAAAEALAALGKDEPALPVLGHWLQQPASPAFRLQAANVVDRLGQRALSLLPVLKQTAETDSPEPGPAGQYARAARHSIAVLEGKTPPLVYPAIAPEALVAESPAARFLGMTQNSSTTAER